MTRGLLSALPGAFYLRGQGPSICVARGLLSAWPGGALYLRGQGPSTGVYRGLLSVWPGVFYLREDQGGHRGGEDDFASLEGLVRLWQNEDC